MLAERKYKINKECYIEKDKYYEQYQEFLDEKGLVSQDKKLITNVLFKIYGIKTDRKVIIPKGKREQVYVGIEEVKSENSDEDKQKVMATCGHCGRNAICTLDSTGERICNDCKIKSE